MKSKSLLLLIFILSNLLLWLSACQEPLSKEELNPETTASETESEDINSDPNNVNENSNTKEKNLSYQLQEIPEKAGASCFYYQIVDQNQNPIKVSKDLQESLDCPFALPIFTPNNQEIIYFNPQNNKLISYNFQNQSETELMSFYEDNSGTELISWSPDKHKLLIMSANYNQIDYPEISKLFVLKFDENYQLEQKDKYNVKVNFTCSSANCGPNQEDIQWISDTEIEYQTWNEVPYDLEGEEAKQILYINP